MNTRFMQEVIYQWVRRCFGGAIADNRAERSLRILEEAAELAQCAGVAKDKIDAIVEEVFSRPVGDHYQEIGGILVTVYAYCESNGMNAEGALMQETKRILNRDPEYFRKRMNEKISKGLAVTDAQITG